MSSITVRAATQSIQTSSGGYDSERQPLLQSPNRAEGALLRHWDQDHVGNRMRQYNVPHQVVRSWVPAPLIPERSAPSDDAVPPFEVTPQDSVRGATITAGTQSLLGTFFVAGAIDSFFAPGPSLTNPSGQVHPVAGSACVVAASLGYTVVGAAIGNLWYNALLTMSARHHSVIARHPVAADRTAATFAIATTLACLIGAGFLGADFHRRLHDAPPDGPAPANIVYEYTLAMLALFAGPYASGCSNWYIGRVVGAGLADAFDCDLCQNEEYFTDEDVSEA